MFIPMFTTNAMTSDFLSSISLFESYAPRLQSHGVYISKLVRFTMCCTSVLDFLSKNLNITSKLLTRVTYIMSFEKHLVSSSGHTLSFYLNLVKYRFKNMFLKKSLIRYSTVIWSSNKGGQTRNEFLLFGLQNS